LAAKLEQFAIAYGRYDARRGSGKKQGEHALRHFMQNRKRFPASGIPKDIVVKRNGRLNC